MCCIAGACLEMLSSAMLLLRGSRANAALTIQLFSQLFHYVNMYLFNWLVSREGAVYCSRAWARRLRERLALLQAWALRQGLELAAECHLDRVVQVRECGTEIVNGQTSSNFESPSSSAVRS